MSQEQEKLDEPEETLEQPEQPQETNQNDTEEIKQNEEQSEPKEEKQNYQPGPEVNIEGSPGRQEQYDIQEIMNEINQLKRDRDQEVEQLNAQIQSQQQQIHDIMSEKQSLDIQLQEKSSTIQQLQIEITTLKSQTPQNGTSAPAPQDPSKVTINKEDLVKWSKKLQDMSTQLKSVQMENQQLKLELEQKEKLQNSKKLKNDLSLEGLTERCKALQNIIDQTSQQNSKLESQISTQNEQNAQLRDDLNASIAEVKSLRQISKDKFRIETELTQALQTIDELRYKARESDETQQKLNKLEQENSALKQSLKQTEAQKEKVQKQYQETYVQLQDHLSDRNKLVTEKDMLGSKVRDLERMLSQQFADAANLDQQLKDSTQQNEDLRSQIKILARKHASEIEEVRNEWNKQQEIQKQLLDSNHKLQNDLQVLRDHAFRRSSVSDDPKKIDKKEKVILESLSVRVNELELENQKLRQKVQYLDKQIDAKQSYILSIFTELTKNHPTIKEDLAILDKDDQKLLKQYQQYDKLALNILLEKLFIENVQLREQIRILGQELNQMFQKK